MPVRSGLHALRRRTLWERFHVLDQPLQDFAGRDVVHRVPGQVHLRAKLPVRFVAGGLDGLFQARDAARQVLHPLHHHGQLGDIADALDFLSAGARMVQVGTANLVNPEAALEVWTGLKAYSQKNRLSNWDQIVGRARRRS